MISSQSDNHRIEWIDIARGIAIVLMVVGHSSIPESLSKYIWSFHMPLFFVVSGIFFNPQKIVSFKELVRKRFFTLFIPYWFFTLVVFFAYYGTEYYKPYELYKGWEGYALWFVPVLFFAELAFYPISRLRKIWIIITIFLTTSLGYLLSIYHIHLYFKIEAVPFALFFIASGNLLKKQILSFTPNILIVTLIGIITIILSQVLPKLDIGRNDFGCIIPNLFNALLGIYFIFSISKYLNFFSKYYIIRFLDYFGRNSLYVMAFSQVFNYWILVSLTSIRIANGFGILIRYILLFSAIYISSIILPKYMPYLVGAKIKRK